MNLVSFALHRPITVLVAVIAVILTGLFAIQRLPRDVFPQLGVPVIYVAQPYGGMDPAQMEAFLVNYYEYHFFFISGIEHVESKSIQGMALIKLQFHAGTDMATALAETVSYANRARAYMPPGTVPPYIMRFDAGTVPVGYLVLSDETAKHGLNELQDAALFRVRPLFATLSGVSPPTPFGGSPRAIVVNVNPDRLRAYNMSPEEVVEAITRGNTIVPSGNIRIGDEIPIVPVNSVVSNIQRLGDIPIRSDGTRTIFVRDVGAVTDSADTEVGYALVDGRRTVYMPVTKLADASTLSVVNLVKANIERFQSVLPPGVKVTYEFDQSPFVTRAIWSLTEEGALGAILTGLMILLFLRDWRSAAVVVVNIPLSILAAIIALAASGQTINIMTLGGLALAVGILVDEATVVTENVHTHMRGHATLAQAVQIGTVETRVPNFVAMLCILAVFVSAFFMQGAARNLFIPLAMAVAFAMIASYILSSTLVPILLIWLLRAGHATPEERRGWFDRFCTRYHDLSARNLRRRWFVASAYLVVAALIIVFVGGSLGRTIFPLVNEGQFTLRLRARAGTRIEETERIANRAMSVIKEVVEAKNVRISVGFVGVQHPAYPINAIYQWTSGPEAAILHVQLKRAAPIGLSALRERLRKRLAEELPGIRFRFEPSDIVSQVMSFGAPTPIEVAIRGPNFRVTRPFAEKIKSALREIPSLRDIEFEQALEFPAVKVTIDRELAGTMGLNVGQIARSLTEATSSSRYVVPNFWADPASGVGYRIQVQLPPEKMDSLEQVRNIPIARRNGGQIGLRNVADVTEGTVMGEYDRYDQERMLTIAANIFGEDLGGAADAVERAIDRVGPPPRGVNVVLRGQAAPMRQMFNGLILGLAVAVTAIFLMLAANFQSFRLALAVILTIPSVIAGVVLALWVTGSSVNIESLIGTIMAVGVAVANAILLVTFAERSRTEGASVRDAALNGASSRLRPILMTSSAMVAGMLPMAAAIGEGGSQTAPLGRAVIGGLIGATFATLVALPAIFSILQSDRAPKSRSLLPDEPLSEVRP